jgi:hypothetical protein
MRTLLHTCCDLRAARLAAADAGIGAVRAKWHPQLQTVVQLGVASWGQANTYARRYEHHLARSGQHRTIYRAADALGMELRDLDHGARAA